MDRICLFFRLYYQESANVDVTLLSCCLINKVQKSLTQFRFSYFFEMKDITRYIITYYTDIVLSL